MRPFIFFLMSVAIPAISFALPVLNRSAPANELFTIYPDHSDNHLYYIAPNKFIMARDTNNVPLFSYQEYRVGLFSKNALVHVIMVTGQSQEVFESAKKAVTKADPAAKFAPLPFLSSRVIFNKELNPFVLDNSCLKGAGQVADEESCSFIINNRGRKAMFYMLQTSLALTFDFEYTLEGYVERAPGVFQGKNATFVIAGRVGSGSLADYPELFRDENGKTINYRTWSEETE